jgi:hypothetical protein
MMPKKSLKQTNPYLEDPELCKELLYQSVSSSAAVEGILSNYPRMSKAAEKKLQEVIAALESSTSSE